MSQLVSSYSHTSLSSPMPGTVVHILARQGDHLQEGQRVFVVESMKMLHDLRVSKPGKLSAIHVKVGDVVQPHNHLAYIV